MNEVLCKHKYEDGTIKEWKTTWVVTKKTDSVTYIRIEGRDSALNVIVGPYSSWNFLSDKDLAAINSKVVEASKSNSENYFLVIPAIDVGCSLAPLDDLVWNIEKLSSLVSETDAVTIATALMDFSKI